MNTKSFKEAWEDVPGDGWLTEDEGNLLYETAAQTTGNILEVGCYKGRSTVLLAGLGRRVLSVDPFDGFTEDHTGDEICEIFKQTLRERGINNVSLYRTKIENWIDQPIGFAYLDGDHTYEGTLAQIQVAVRCGATHICIHDYAKTLGGANVARAIRDFPLHLHSVVGRMASCRFFTNGYGQDS